MLVWHNKSCVVRRSTVSLRFHMCIWEESVGLFWYGFRLSANIVVRL